jgi:hypothetical protein
MREIFAEAEELLRRIKKTVRTAAERSAWRQGRFRGQHFKNRPGNIPGVNLFVRRSTE